MTVEEILVKFTGDASSLTGASDKAKNKTKDLKEEVEKLDRVMKVSKVGTSGYEMTLKKLEATTRKYAEALEKVNLQEKKLADKQKTTGSSPRMGGGYGGGGGGRLGIGGSFLAGAGVSAATALGVNLHDSAKSLFSQAEQAIQNQLSGFSGGDIKSIEQSERIQKEEEERAGFLASIRNRQIGDRANAVGREGAGRNPAIQLQEQLKFQRDLQKQIDQSKNSQNNYKSEIEKTNSAFHVLRPSMKMAYDAANQGLKEEIAHYKALESAAHSAGEKIKDMHAQAWQAGEQRRQQLAAIGEGLSGRLLGLNPNISGEELEFGRIKEDERKRIQELPNETQANKDKMLANSLEQLEAKFRTVQLAREDAFNMDFLRGQESKIRSFGKTAAEAFLLQQRALGKEVPGDRAESILDAENKLRGLEITERFKTPFEKGMQEKAKLDAIRGEMSAETYQRAMAEIDKGMRGPGAAASRAATGYGSAEHSARMYAYSQVMTQPATQQANIDRLSREPGKTTDKQTEGNNYLRSIRDAIKSKKSVEVQPANLGS